MFDNVGTLGFDKNFIAMNIHESPKILLQFENKEISHLKANSNYTFLFGFDGTKAISAYSLKVFEELLEDKDYIRIDRSNLVCRSFIEGVFIKDGSFYIKLQNDKTLKIPRRKKVLMINYLNLN